ncbi:MAG: hypothetical protein ABIJ84_01670 [bacterium]
MKNKKILFLVLFTVSIFPLTTGAQGLTFQQMAETIKLAIGSIGVSIVAIGWLIAGILYLTSAGSPEKTGTAKKALTAAVIGTVLVVLAYVAGSIIASLLGVPLAP